ncbi:hypothetical protein AVEN_247166-1, partial [Araneus ventricosus]
RKGCGWRDTGLTSPSPKRSQNLTSLKKATALERPVAVRES